MKTRVISILCFLIGLYLIVSFSRDLWRLAQKEGEIQKANARLEKLKTQNQELGKKVKEVQTPEFVEKEAREKLGLAKEGETVVMLPENFEKMAKIDQSSDDSALDLPNWERWWQLFF